MNRFLVLCFAILFSTLSIGLFGGSSVSAASIYDNTYHTTEDFTITGTQCPAGVDMSDWIVKAMDWESYAGVSQSTAEARAQDVSDAWDATVDSPTGAWSVSRYVDDRIDILLAPDGGDIVFETVLIGSNNVRVARVVSDNVFVFSAQVESGTGISCDKMFSPSATGGFGYRDYTTYTNEAQILSADPTDTWLLIKQNIFAGGFDIIYPLDYEGEDIREGLGEGPHYTAGTGLIPLSDYTVDDLDIDIIDVTSQSEKILYKIDECMFQLPNNSSGDNFTEYMYDCDNPTTIEHTFGDGYAGYNIIHRMHSTETDLWYESTQVLDVDGSTFSGSIGLIYEDIFAKCVNGDAPFIHFKECYTTFGKIANSMSFGAIKPLEAFRYEPTSECRALGTLGDWMNLDNKTICPQFPAEVRNVVTPFISFGISLGVLGAILVKSDKDYM